MRGSPAHRLARSERALDVATMAVLGALGGAIAGASPSGLTAADLLLAAAAAGAVAVAGSRARPWTLFPMATVGAAFGTPPIGLACGVLALVAAAGALMDPRSARLVGALAGALGAQALLRLDVPGPLGVDTMVGFAAAVPVLVSGYRLAPTAGRRGARWLVGGSVAAVVVLGSAGVASVMAARTPVDQGIREIQEGMRAARAGDSEAAADLLADAHRSFAQADRSLGAWWAKPAAGLPVVGTNLRAIADTASLAADLTAVAADGMAETAAADLVVRKGQIPIAAFAALEDPLLRLQDGLTDARRRLDDRGSVWELGPVQSRLDDVAEKVRDATHDADVALAAVRTLPDVFGASGQRRYLALFVTPVEGRASGFPGNFAELVITDGKIEMTRFDRIGELDRLLGDATVSMPPDYEQRYGRFGGADSWRNTTLTPDFPTVAELVRQLYPQSGGAELDGVLSVDPAALAALLRLTGPVSVPDLRRPLSARNAEQFLLRDQYVDLPDRPERIDALESLGRGTFDALLDRDLPDPQEIARIISPAFDEQHLRFVAFQPDATEFLDEINVTGALLPVSGDALAVTSNNLIGNKTDLFLQRRIDYDVEWDPGTRTVRSVLRVHLVNDAPGSGLPDYVIGNALGEGDQPPPGTNRTYVSVFTPLALEGARLNGQVLPMESQVEAGRNVFSTFLELGPAGGEAILELVLQGSIGGTGGYRLDLAPQVLARPDVLDVAVRSAGRTLYQTGDHLFIARETVEQ